MKRGMRGEDAKKLCADFHIFYVNQKRGKADLTKYRDASAKIFEILLKHCANVEKASIDEAYLDVTELVLNRIRNGISLPNVLKGSLIDTYLADSKIQDELDKWLDNCADLKEETSDALLFVGALIAQEIRQDIYATLGYKCSAGIAHNKVYFCIIKIKFLLILANGLVSDSCQIVLRFEQTEQTNRTSTELRGQFAQQNANKQNV